MTTSILVVDDTPANLRLLCSMLAEHGYETRPVTDGQTAINAALADPPDMILLDINMPNMNGYEVCETLKADGQLEDIPVIFISALNETVDKVRAFAAGGLDYISKPFHIDEVLARISTQLALREQRREIERLREQDRQYFEKLSQMKDDMLRIASHDLKNPLSKIMMAAQLIEMNDEISTEVGQRHLGIIQAGAAQMKTLIADILDLAQLETGLALNKKDLHLNEFLQYIVDSAQMQVEEKSLDLYLQLPTSRAIIEGDPARLGQVVENLVSNAIKYTPVGGQITVGCHINADHTVTITVEDTGLGIPHDDIPHLFEKFYRVNTEEHQSTEGTGLGLSIVQTIVEQHHGTIWVESTLGEGSCFNVCLPLAETSLSNPLRV